MLRLLPIALLAVFCSATDAYAQHRGVLPREQIDSLVNPRATEQSALMFEAREQRISDLSEDDAPVSVEFRFRNQSTQPVVITRVVTSCGCLAADYPREPLPAGGEGTIRITFNPKGHPGKLFRKAFVYTTLSQTSPTAQLAVTGDVRPTADKWGDYPDQMGALRCRRTNVVFRDPPREGKAAECIECINTGEKPLRLTAGENSLPPYLTLRTSPEVVEPGMVADLIFLLDASKLPPNAASGHSFNCLIEGLEGPQDQRTIRIDILSR